MKGILKVKELAAYIAKRYYEKFNKEISPVRLQKTLYFSFAYWGGFIRKGKKQENPEIDVSNYSEYLFDSQIQAWVYGPVVPDVYFEENITQYENDELFNNDELLQTMIDNVIDETFEVNDFKLVDISHSDDAWKINFDYDEQYHNREIDKEYIIEEYARRK